MSQWKACERAVAAKLGGRRVPITGRQRGDVPDVAHSWLSIEVKHRKTLPAWLFDAMAQAMAAADDGKLPIVVLHEAGRLHDNDYVVVRMKDFVKWFIAEWDGDAWPLVDDAGRNALADGIDAWIAAQEVEDGAQARAEG